MIERFLGEAEWFLASKKKKLMKLGRNAKVSNVVSRNVYSKKRRKNL